MAKKLRLISDPTLAKSHEAGAVVELTQPVLHSQFGVIYYLSPKMYSYHVKEAEISFGKLNVFQDKILDLPLENDNARMISDYDFLGRIYLSGFDLILHTYLAFDHLLLDILMTVYKDPERRKIWNDREMLGKANHVIKKVFGRADILQTIEYAGLVEIEQQRHSFNHPTSRRIYSADLNTWDEVPLAWIISGKYKEVYINARQLFDEIYELWNTEKEKYNHPGTLTVQRGIRSLHQTKKPLCRV